MRAEDFDTATVDQLLERANKCFEQAQSPLEEDPHYLDDGGKLRLLLEAQFYLAAVVRKRDDKNSRRDFRLELVVIVLISIEIVLSFGFGFWGIHEGKQQSKILEHMDASSAATATAMEGASKALNTLSEEQQALIKSQKIANENQQATLRRTGAMAGALEQQLKILRKEQDDRLAQLSKKPKFELYVGNVPINTALKVQLTIREQTDTSMTYDISLKNIGTATANRGNLRMIIESRNVSAICSSGCVQVPDEPGTAYRVFVVPFEYLHPGIHIPMTATFTFPKYQAPFSVLFNVDANEIDSGTFLGQIQINPRKPLN